MSAICGMVHLNGEPVDARSLDRMMASLSHRGKDRSHHIIRGHVGFGHQMFCTTHSSQGEVLPCLEPEKGILLTGDIHLGNREELLPWFGYSPNDETVPDSRLVLHAYEKWGIDMVHRLIGHFALALWDAVTGTLYLVTDHTGTRSIFYHKSESGFFFASDIKAIHATGRVPRIVDKEHLATHLAIPLAMHVRPDYTFFKDIRAMCAAHVMTVTPQRCSETQYWKPDIEKRLTVKSEGEWREAFQDLFFKVGKAHLRSAFPVTALLSGGLDSSAIVAATAKILQGKGQRLTTLSSVATDQWAGQVVDERHYIDQFKTFKNLDMHYIQDDQIGPFSNMEGWNDDAPFRISRHFLYTAFCQAAQDLGSRVVLEGVFGEHGPSFHGLGCLADSFRKGRWLYVMKEINAISQRENRHRLNVLKSHVIKAYLPRRMQRNHWETDRWTGVKKEFIDRHLNRELFQSYCMELGDLLSERVNHRKNQVALYLRKRICWPRNSYQGYDQVVFRYPYSDPRMIEFCLATPGKFKIQNGYRRNLIRIGMKGLLPEAIRLRTSKEPFSPDYHLRFIKQLPSIQSWLSDIKHGDPIHEIVDMGGMNHWMASFMSEQKEGFTNREQILLHDFPRLVYLARFLQRNPD